MMRQRQKMMWIAVLALVLVVVACRPTPAPAAPVEVREFANPQLLVSTEWLAEHLKDADLRVVDARKAEEYAAGHIPGAVNIPRAATFDPEAPKGMIGKPEQIAELFGDQGINEKVHVVVYGEGKDKDAARIFWTLEYYGHPNISVLNGGYAKWQAEGRKVTTEEPEITPVEFSLEVHPEVLTTKEEILDKIGQEGVTFLDARSEEEYKGRDVRAKRGGHIPGAVNVDWRENFTPGDAPVFKSPAELEKLYADAGVTRDQEVHAY